MTGQTYLRGIQTDDTDSVVLSVNKLNVYYGNFHAVLDIDMDIKKNRITALIGPSGCGKSTFLRCLNRMNDLILGARVEGEVIFEDQNIYSLSLIHI